jgi:hypothetical protein
MTIRAWRLALTSILASRGLIIAIDPPLWPSQD